MAGQGQYLAILVNKRFILWPKNKFSCWTNAGKTLLCKLGSSHLRQPIKTSFASTWPAASGFSNIIKWINKFLTCKGPTLPSLTALAITVRRVEKRKSCWVLMSDSFSRPHMKPKITAKCPCRCLFSSLIWEKCKKWNSVKQEEESC